MNESNRILVADDDLFRDTTAALLRKAGYAVDCASDAMEASQMLSAAQYDLLIADIKMPGNAQLQLVLEVSESARGLPIILATGYPALETAVKAVRRGRSVSGQARGPGRLARPRQGVGCQKSSLPDRRGPARATDDLGR